MKNVVKNIVLILLLAAAAGFVVWVATLFIDDDKTVVPPADEVNYFVSFDGNDYSSESGAINMTLPVNGQMRIDVSGTDSYTVKVGSSYFVDEGGALELIYTVDGENYLPMADDYTDEFIKASNLYDSYFVIDCTPGYYDYHTLLCRHWNSDNVQFLDELTHEYPYKMTITSAEGEEIVIQLNQAQ